MHGQVADLLSISSAANIEQAAALIAQYTLDLDVKNTDGETLKDLADRASKASIRYLDAWNKLMKVLH